MEPKYRRCCGIDVHKKSVTICVLPPVGKPETGVRKRNFPTFTRDLKQLRTWLKNCKVTEIAMESTGQYWRAIWNVLEGHFEKLILVNPQHIFALAQRTEWLQNRSQGCRVDCGTARGRQAEGQLGAAARDS
jgi:transposase